MAIYAFAGLSLLLLVFLYGKNRYRIVYIKPLILPVLCISFILCLILFSKNAVTAASKGLKLWLEIVFPSLFPFIVASELLNRTSFVRASGIILEPVMRPVFNLPGPSSFALIIGIICGNPVGAKAVTNLYRDGLLTKPEAEKLLAFSNNIGPLFIVGAVSVGMLKMPSAGLFLLACHIAACITVGMLMRYYKPNKDKDRSFTVRGSLIKRFKKELYSRNPGAGSSFGHYFGEAVRNAVMTLLVIGGFIIVFSVIISILLETGIILIAADLISPVLLPFGIGREIIAAVLSGIFEITTGTSMAASAAGADLVQRLTAVSFIMGWAGLSIHSQVSSIIAETNINIIPYIVGKLLQGILAALYTLIGIKIAGPVVLRAEPAFLHMYSSEDLSWVFCLLSSCTLLFWSLTAFTAICILSLFINYLSGITGRHRKLF